MIVGYIKIKPKYCDVLRIDINMEMKEKHNVLLVLLPNKVRQSI